MPNQGIVSIVDDDRSIRRATRSLVRSLGWEVRVYESGEEFLDADLIMDVACIISDVQMKGITGLEMYEALLERGPAPPVIFITAFPSEAAREQAMKLGAICVFSKPVDPAQIKQRLEDIGSERNRT
ncbi:response regulator transcription factor [Burkholderia sola]|uniref:response regulator transcription factor n=1 Tax=Burkholderia sola TaxID=2843302 RepID=UPI001C0A81FA|nr:two-component regulatory system, response regulator protein [Burkholderia cenocepacia]CAG2331885.1 two-component regulatory system, response regulator protein [Burkholderia cenocepacia]CAG2331914.1 two-component regulatory system, response regulator protein [Burkholderia cenocepacia]CAG2331943.1 two-component regulatory system, response regulator protein [Burkholderia cenocepacia]CAG2331965.1 two-component regulatory system, response regulator protein [Burkholderia cenocepacia]